MRKTVNAKVTKYLEKISDVRFRVHDGGVKQFMDLINEYSGCFCAAILEAVILGGAPWHVRGILTCT